MSQNSDENKKLITTQLLSDDLVQLELINKEKSDSVGRVRHIVASLLIKQGLIQRSQLRRWWYEVLQKHGVYKCYAVFLVLPSDTEVIEYLDKFGQELDIISDTDCLIMVFGSRFGYFDFNQECWNLAVEEYVSEGYSVKLARFFNIDLVDFPCVIFFEDIRSDTNVAIALKDLSVEEIGQMMRSTFSIIRQSVSKKENPVTAMQNYQHREYFLKSGKTVLKQFNDFAGKTLETLMEAWIKANIK